MSTVRLLTILKAAAERAASGGRVLKALLGLSALLLAFAPPMARAGGAAGGPNFQVCDGYYALCAASTCVTTNKTITVNGTESKIAVADLEIGAPRSPAGSRHRRRKC